ncbi:MAG: hypothetical protein U0R50_08310 [Gaiellales bacterium]
MSERPRPAFYAAGHGGAVGDWVTLLHLPYTAWHLSYVVVGACLAPRVDWVVLGWSLAAFALALGIGAHALDELHGRPLATGIPASLLVAVAVASVAGAVAIGIVVSASTSWWLLVPIALGAVLVPAYNLELGGGIVHTDLGFALAWGAFPVLTAYLAQTGAVTIGASLAALCAVTLSLAQRRLSSWARLLRRDVVSIDGEASLSDGTVAPLTRDGLLRTPEAVLRLLTATTVLAALTAVALRA